MITLLFSVLNSDLTVDPPEGSFSHAVEFDEDLPDPARLQQKDELLLQLPDVHTRWSCGGMKSQVLRDGNVPVSSYRSRAGERFPVWQTTKHDIRRIYYLECRRKKAEAWRWGWWWPISSSSAPPGPSSPPPSAAPWRAYEMTPQTAEAAPPSFHTESCKIRTVSFKRWFKDTVLCRICAATHAEGEEDTAQWCCGQLVVLIFRGKKWTHQRVVKYQDNLVKITSKATQTHFMKIAMFFLDVSDGRSFSRESVQTCRTKNVVALKISGHTELHKPRHICHLRQLIPTYHAFVLNLKTHLIKSPPRTEREWKPGALCVCQGLCF